MTRADGWAARLWAGLRLAWGMMMPLALLIIAGVLYPASDAADWLAAKARGSHDDEPSAGDSSQAHGASPSSPRQQSDRHRPPTPPRGDPESLQPVATEAASVDEKAGELADGLRRLLFARDVMLTASELMFVKRVFAALLRAD